MRRRSQPEHVARVIAGKIAAAAHGEAHQAAAVDFQGDPGAHNVPMLLPPQFHAEPVVAGARLVAQDRDRFIRVTDHQVYPSVIVEIA